MSHPIENGTSPFHAQFTEVINDLVFDVGATLFDVDPGVADRIQDILLQIFRTYQDETDDDSPGILLDLSTVVLWMFLAGREHAVRGYPSPIVRDGESFSVPDDLSGLADLDPGPDDEGADT